VNDYVPDLQGWSSQHALLVQAIESGPRIVVEVGVWKGGSVVFMAELLRERNADSVIIAVDTWLGSWEHWARPDWRSDLLLKNGYPTFYRTFQRNIVACHVQDYVIPLPLDSVNAASLLRSCGIVPDVVHVDAGHDYRSVLTDLETWWECLRPAGILVADDYDPAGRIWPSVKNAVDAFVREAAPLNFEAVLPKAIMKKPLPQSKQ
jgi:predicted O-methyltransferase YrrM